MWEQYHTKEFLRGRYDFLKKCASVHGVREEIDNACYLSFEEKQNVGVLMEFVRRLIMHVTSHLKSKEGCIMDGYVGD